MEIIICRMPYNYSKCYTKKSKTNNIDYMLREIFWIEDTSNIVGGSLESPWWLLLAFCPKILGGVGD